MQTCSVFPPIKRGRYSRQSIVQSSLVVSNLPSLSDQLTVVRVGAPSDNELRMRRPSAISGTKARVTGDDDFITIDCNESDVSLSKTAAPKTPTVPPGPISMEQDGDNLFLRMHGIRIAKRGRPGTRKTKKWILFHQLRCRSTTLLEFVGDCSIRPR